MSLLTSNQHLRSPKLEQSQPLTKWFLSRSSCPEVLTGEGSVENCKFPVVNFYIGIRSWKFRRKMLFSRSKDSWWELLSQKFCPSSCWAILCWRFCQRVWIRTLVMRTEIRTVNFFLVKISQWEARRHFASKFFLEKLMFILFSLLFIFILRLSSKFSNQIDQNGPVMVGVFNESSGPFIVRTAS